MTAQYTLRGVQHRYGTRTVLSLDALEILQGEVLAIVGPSGAGKSTLLRLLNFLEPPTDGVITFDGQTVTARPPLDLIRRVTTVFQRPVLLDRNVHDNVAFGLRLRGQAVDGRVDAALAHVGLSGLDRAQARKLSGGEMQRAALARALVIEPEVLLLDEPTANLDPYNVGLIEGILAAQNRERGTTLVLVTHNVFQARRLAHRVALLWDGRLIEVNRTADFFDSPSDPRSAAFAKGEVAY
ncbi:MAG: phosphate ABC transporter ATP-binding protein [Anaerolineales bacterium]|nr:phosphate ABC transporter ATP-binding protein [Anaerolineales bacterium]